MPWRDIRDIPFAHFMELQDRLMDGRIGPMVEEVSHFRSLGMLRSILHVVSSFAGGKGQYRPVDWQSMFPWYKSDDKAPQKKLAMALTEDERRVFEQIAREEGEADA